MAVLLFLILAQDVDALDAETPEERERAHAALLEKGDAAKLRAALPGASGERRVRLEAILQELAFRAEEKALAAEGLPPGLARKVPRVRERFLAGDDAAVVAALAELFDARGHPRLQLDVPEASALVRVALERARTPELKASALRLASSLYVHGVERVVAPFVEDPDPLVRGLALDFGAKKRLPGSEAAQARRLKEGNDAERARAVRALGELKTPAACAALRPALADPLPALRAEAARLLVWAGDEGVGPLLRPLLKDPDASVRLAALGGLSNLRVRDAWDDIPPLAGDPDHNVRRAVLSLIARWQEPRGAKIVLDALRRPEDAFPFAGAIEAADALELADARPLLLDLLPGPSGEQAARAVAAIGAGPVEAKLLELARGPDAVARRHALSALVGTRSPAAVEAFLAALGDPATAEAAITGLARARSPETLAGFRKALKIPELRARALQAMSESLDPAVLPLAAEALEDVDPEVVRAALKVVERGRSAEALPALGKLLTSASAELAHDAAGALWRIEGARARPALLKLTGHEDPRVRRRAWNLLHLDPAPETAEAAMAAWPEAAAEARGDLMAVISGVVNERTSDFLRRLARDPREPFRGSARRSLVYRGDPAARALAEEELRSKDARVRAEAAAQFFEAGGSSDEAAKILAEACAQAEEFHRGAYLRPLAEARRPEARPPLLERLRDPDWYDRDQAAAWMAAYPRGAFDADIRRLAADADPIARRGAARALTHADLAGRLELLRPLLADAAASVREEAVMAFWHVKALPPPKELVDRLDDPAPEVRRWAVDVLSGLDPAALAGKAEALLGDASGEVRAKAAVAVGRGKLGVSRAKLLALLDDRHDDARSQAAWALGVLGEKEAVEKLARLWREDRSQWTRSAAAHALLTLGAPNGLEAVRSLVREAPVVEGHAHIVLLERGGKEDVGPALDFVERSSSTFYEGNRALLALNAFEAPELYARAKELKVHPRGWPPGEAAWRAKMGEALGVPVEADPRVATKPIEGRRRRSSNDRPFQDELASVGFYLDAAAVFEKDRIRIVPRREAIALWRGRLK